MQDTSIMKYPISAAPANTPVTILRTGGEYHIWAADRPHIHSMGATREWNVSSTDLYIKGIERNQRDFETENLDQTTRYNEFIITTIRTIWGTPIEKLKSRVR